MTYCINAEPAGRSFQVEVTPTLEALGDQPWRVVLRDTDGAFLDSMTIESFAGLAAATDAVENWLAGNGYKETQSLQINCL